MHARRLADLPPDHITFLRNEASFRRSPHRQPLPARAGKTEAIAKLQELHGLKN